MEAERIIFQHCKRDGAQYCASRFGFKDFRGEETKLLRSVRAPDHSAHTGAMLCHAHEFILQAAPAFQCGRQLTFTLTGDVKAAKPSNHILKTFISR
jgi:hypothetical protein